MESMQIHQAERVQRLAEEYASYSMTKGGLGNVLGGFAGIAICLVNNILGRGTLTLVLTAGLTAGWLIGKEVLRRLLYRAFGEARENWSPRQNRYQLKLALWVAIVAVGIWIWFLWTYFFGRALIIISPLQLILGLSCAALAPWIAWRYLHNNDELLVGMFLLLCCAIASIGGVLGQGGHWGWAASAWVPLYGLGMIVRGIDEHRKFGRLAQQLSAWEEDQ